MDQFFNPRAAKWARDLVIKMADDEAELFVRLATFDILMADIEANRRAVDIHTQEVHKRLAQRVSKALTRTYSAERAGDYLAAAAAVSLVSKSAEWEEKEHPRAKDGRFRRKGSSEVTFTFSRKKTGPEINLTQALGRTGGKISQFEQEWNRTNPEQASTNRRTYDRIAAGSRVLSSSGNPKLMAAGQFGEFVGRYGPEAEKVIGPHLRRTTYRYRGTERRLDSALIQSTNDKTRDLLRGQKNQEITPDLRADASRQAAAAYLLKRLPSTKLTDLQLKSGKVPPSEGVIINADGKIITQAVGYSDDHYLPFNLKNLKGLQGGQYVRSRASGGPTTEDIYAGLVSGARSVTVVSRSGIFTIDFDDAFRGSRRYNDKAAQMVSRYGKLLDAIKSEQVERSKLSPEDRARLRDEVESEMEGLGYSRTEVERAVQQRIKEYKSNPELSTEELASINREAKAAHPEDEKKQRIARADMIDRAMEEKASNKYRLDGEGYAAALDALREQFPYYLDRINYVHRKSEGGLGQVFSTEPDTGYVAPRYLRPQAAQEGYFDREVNGRGKISAKHINYANWQHNPERTAGRSAEMPRQTDEAPAPQKTNATDALRAARVRAAASKGAADALWSAAKQLEEMHENPGDELSRLISNRENFDQVFADPVRRRRAEETVRRGYEALDTEQNRAKSPGFFDSMDQLLRTYSLQGKALEHRQFSNEAFEESLGNSPSQPFDFNEKPYKLGEADRATIEREWMKHNPPFEIGEKSDDEIRKMASGWGALSRRAAEGGDLDSREMSEILVSSGLDEHPGAIRMMQQLANGQLSSEQRSNMASAARNNALAMERLRKLQANHQALPEPAIEAGPRTTEFQATKNDPNSVADQLDDLAAQLSGDRRTEVVARGYGRVAQLLRDYADGELDHEELITEIDHRIGQFGGGEIIRGMLKKAGIVDD